MQKFINRVMNNVHNDFCVALEGMDRLCDLKLRFDGRNIPDYNDPRQQQLYLLRYFPAYFVEYYKIYERLIELNFLQFPLTVLSIGCGCGIDYYGLFFVAKDHKRVFIDSVRYTGIDIVDWQYKENLENQHTQFLVEDIANSHQLDNNSYNVIVFPKSIGELPPQTFDALRRIFTNSTFTQDRICLINSLREQRSNTDSDRFVTLINILRQRHRYTTTDDTNRVDGFGEQSIYRAIRNHTIKYPELIKAHITALLETCDGYIENNHQSHRPDCRECINRQPVLTTNHMRFQLVKLER